MRTLPIGILTMIAASVLVLWTRFPIAAGPLQASNGSLKIGNEDLGAEDGAVLVSVTKAGAILKSSDCSSTHSISWEKVPEGDYEVRFESPSRRTVLKRIHISAGEETVLSAKLPEGNGVIGMGGGPSLTELDARVKRLESTLAAMRKK